MLSISTNGLRGAIILSFLSLCGTYSFLGAMAPNYRNYGVYDPRIAQIVTTRQICEGITDLRTRRDARAVELRAINAGATEADFMRDETYLRYANDIASLSDNSIPHRMMMRASQEIENFVGDKVKATSDRVLGDAWDALVDRGVDYVRDANSWLFHQSIDPFMPNELRNWSDVIGSCLDGFGNLIKGRLEFESRSNDKNSRAFDSEDQSTVNQDQVVAELLLKHYAAQCDYYALAIDKRKGYYKEGSEIVFIADQLKDWLMEFKHIILSIKSLKDVSAKFGANDKMIKETANNIKKLFEKLGAIVTPPSYTTGNRDTKWTKPTSTDSVQRRNYAGHNDEFPLGFDN